MLTLSWLKWRFTRVRSLKTYSHQEPVGPVNARASKPYQFGKFELDIPPDHKIEEIHKIDLLYDRNFGPILECLSSKYPDDTVIDIGANVGDTAAVIRTHCNNPILCIEGGAPFLPYLRTNVLRLGRNVDVIEKFVTTSANQDLSFVYTSGAGTGVLSAKGVAQGEMDKSRFVTVHDLQELQRSRNSDVCLVKSDTDGFDGPILQDVMATFKTNLYFECDPNAQVSDKKFDWPDFFRLLERERYSVAVFDNFGLPMFFASGDYTKIISELLHYVELQRTLRRISIYYYDVWAFRPEDDDLFRAAQLHFKPEPQRS